MADRVSDPELQTPRGRSLPLVPSPVDPYNAIRAEIEEIRRAIRREAGIEDFKEFCLHPDVQLPVGLNLPKIDLFDGSGDPKTHLIVYIRTLIPMGLRDEHLVQLFQRSLTGPALQWFARLKPSELETFDDLAMVFTKYYESNTLLDFTLKELEMVKQGPEERFGAFMKRWKDKLVQLVDRPSEEEQVKMIKGNLQYRYFKYLVAATNLRDLVHAGMEVEEAIREGKIEGKEQESSSRKRKFSEVEEVNLMGAQSRPKRRKFTSLGRPLSEVMEELVRGGHLKPLDPIPPSFPPPKKFKPDHFCAFHQAQGHLTDRCTRLRHEVQNLIDKRIIPPPICKPNP